MLHVHKPCTVFEPLGAQIAGAGAVWNRCIGYRKVTTPKKCFQFLLMAKNLEKSLGFCARRMKEVVG